MIRILIPKSIKYQVSWYIFGTVSVSVSLIHFRCISIINHWYMTVIHLLELFKTLYWQSLQIVDSLSWVFATVSQIKDFSDSRHVPCRHIVKLITAQHHQLTQQSMLSTSTRPTWVTLTLNWKCWQDAVELSKFSLNSTQLYHSLHQLKDCSARLDRSKCHSATTWVTVSMFEKLLPLKQITVYFKTGFYWHYYLCFSLMALILQFTFWCKLCVRLLVLLCLHFCVFLNMSLASTLGLAEDFKMYQQSIKNHDTFKMYQYHDTFW